MKIRKKYNPLTVTYEYYNIIMHEWVGVKVPPEGSSLGAGLFDSLASSLVSKVTFDTAKKLAQTSAKQALESASKKAGDELGKYAVNRLMPEKIKDKVYKAIRPKEPKTHPDLGADRERLRNYRK